MLTMRRDGRPVPPLSRGGWPKAGRGPLAQDVNRPGGVENQHDHRDDRHGDNDEADHADRAFRVCWDWDARRTRIGCAGRAAGLPAWAWVAGRAYRERIAIGGQCQLAALLERRDTGDEVVETLRAGLAGEPLIGLAKRRATGA